MAITTTADMLRLMPHRFPERTVPVGEVIAALDDRGIAAALLILTLPQLLPIPLGISNILALPIVAVTAQMALGRDRLWMPGWLLQREIQRTTLHRACARAEAPLRRIEQMIRPRLEMLCARWCNRVIGVACLVIALVCFAPLPFTGWLPAWALTIIGIGILERDGVVILAGLSLGAVAFGVFIAVIIGMGEAGTLILSSTGLGP